MLIIENREKYKTGVIHDPLGQSHSKARNETFFFKLKFVLFCLIFESREWRTDGTCVKIMITSDRDLGVGQVDQYSTVSMGLEKRLKWWRMRNH